MEYSPSKAMRRCNHLVGEIDGVYHEMALKLGLSDSAMIVLYTVCDSGGPCPLRDICRRSGLSKQTLNSALRKLEAAGMISLESSGPRSKDVCLTQRGRELARRTAIPLMEVENEIFAGWEPGEVEQYLRLTQRYLDAFREKASRLERRGPGKAGPEGSS